jgi:hypothetical protein
MKCRALVIPLAMLCAASMWGCQGQNEASLTALGPDQQVASKPAPTLTGVTAYEFAGADDPPAFDAEGRLLAWKGTISGDIEGVIMWWMAVPFKYTGQVSHWTDRWEIWNPAETELLLAGDEAGTTTVRHGKNSAWRANGIVTEASQEFNIWIGRQTHDGGNFTWAAPGLPDQGVGTFRVN